jgi:hypothetical protein
MKSLYENNLGARPTPFDSLIFNQHNNFDPSRKEKIETLTDNKNSYIRIEECSSRSIPFCRLNNS